MSKECEYRAYAGACVDLANKATNDDDRKHLLAMAEAWLGLIDRAQRPVDEPDGRSLHPALRAKLGCDESFQRFTRPVSVIASAQVFSGLLKAGRDSVSQQGGDPFPKRLRFRRADHSSELIVQL